MEKTYGLRDRKEWGPGEWDNEPDRVAWVNEETGYPCIIKRGPSGAWCGYVGIPKDHSLHGKDYDSINYDDIDVHGSLTYSDECEGDPHKGICHPSEKGDHVWWFGFDCIHLGDIGPAFEASRKKFVSVISDDDLENTYKNVEYVSNEVVKLARQLKEVHYDNNFA